MTFDELATQLDSKMHELRNNYPDLFISVGIPEHMSFADQMHEAIKQAGLAMLTYNSSLSDVWEEMGRVAQKYSRIKQ